MFDSTLSFKAHVDYIMSKSFKCLGFLKRTTPDFTDVSAIIHLYKSIVLSNLLYCSQIWRPYTVSLKNKVESVQHSFLRYISSKLTSPLHPFCHDYSSMAEDCDIQTVDSIHYLQDCVLSYRIIHGFINCDYLVQCFVERKREREMTYSLRSYRHLYGTTSSHNTGFYSTLNRVKRQWNLLPSTITGKPSILLFKSDTRPLSKKYC